MGIFESQEEKESLLSRVSQGEGLIEVLPERLSVFCLDEWERRFVSGGQDGIVNLWDEYATCVHRMEGHTETVCCVAFLSARVVVSGSVDKTIRVWQTDSGTCLEILKEHTSHVYALCRLQLKGESGLLFASGSHDATIRIWKLVMSEDQQALQSYQCLQSFDAHQRGVRCLLQCDNQLISGGYDKTIKIWDLETNQRVKELTTHTDAVICFALVNLETVEKDENGEEKRITKKCLYSGGLTLDKTIHVWNCEDWELLRSITGHGDGILSLAYVPSLKVMVSGSMDNSIKFWDVETGECKRTIEKAHKWYIYSLKLLDLGEKRFLLSGSQDCSIKIWDIGA